MMKPKLSYIFTCKNISQKIHNKNYLVSYNRREIQSINEYLQRESFSKIKESGNELAVNYSFFHCKTDIQILRYRQQVAAKSECFLWNALKINEIQDNANKIVQYQSNILSWDVRNDTRNGQERVSFFPSFTYDVHADKYLWQEKMDPISPYFILDLTHMRDIINCWKD